MGDQHIERSHRGADSTQQETLPTCQHCEVLLFHKIRVLARDLPRCCPADPELTISVLLLSTGASRKPEKR